ncbi:hypothetical protein Tco_0723189 [Tanacetum coccineum]
MGCNETKKTDPNKDIGFSIEATNVHEKTTSPRFLSVGGKTTGRILKTVCLRWFQQEKTFASSQNKAVQASVINCLMTFESAVQSLGHQCLKTFEQSSSSIGLHVMTFEHNSSSLGLHGNDVCSQTVQDLAPQRQEMSVKMSFRASFPSRDKKS